MNVDDVDGDGRINDVLFEARENQKDGRTSDCHALLLVDTFQRVD